MIATSEKPQRLKQTAAPGKHRLVCRMRRCGALMRHTRERRPRTTCARRVRCTARSHILAQAHPRTPLGCGPGTPAHWGAAGPRGECRRPRWRPRWRPRDAPPPPLVASRRRRRGRLARPAPQCWRRGNPPPAGPAAPPRAPPCPPNRAQAGAPPCPGTVSPPPAQNKAPDRGSACPDDEVAIHPPPMNINGTDSRATSLRRTVRVNAWSRRQGCP